MKMLTFCCLCVKIIIIPESVGNLNELFMVDLLKNDTNQSVQKLKIHKVSSRTRIIQTNPNISFFIDSIRRFTDSKIDYIKSFTYTKLLDIDNHKR